MKMTWKWMSVFWLVPALSGWAGLPTLPRTGEASTAIPSTDMLTLAELMRQGGLLMYVLGALSVLGLALAIYFLIVLRRQSVASESPALPQT